MAQKVLQRAGSWLKRRSRKFLSKHIAKHTRRIAGRAMHSVFKNPRHVRPLIESAIREAADLAARNARAPVEQILQEGGVRVARQATRSPGKFRWVVQKVFAEPIGTAGERILRIVIDQSGRLVTAFPADRLLGVAISSAGVEILTSSTAEAAEIVTLDEQRIAQLNRQKAEPEGLSWEDFVPFLGEVWGGSLNRGENESLEIYRISQGQRRFVDSVVDDIIAEIEHEERRSLGPEERDVVEETVRNGLAIPSLLNDIEAP